VAYSPCLHLSPRPPPRSLACSGTCHAFKVTAEALLPQFTLAGGHSDTVRCVAWLPEVRRLATQYPSERVPLPSVDRPRAARPPRASQPQTGQLLSGGEDGQVCYWTVADPSEAAAAATTAAAVAHGAAARPPKGASPRSGPGPAHLGPSPHNQRAGGGGAKFAAPGGHPKHHKHFHKAARHGHAPY